MSDYKETHEVNYSCGCVHEIGVRGNEMWEATGKETHCKDHVPKEEES